MHKRTVVGFFAESDSEQNFHERLVCHCMVHWNEFDSGKIFLHWFFD